MIALALMLLTAKSSPDALNYACIRERTKDGRFAHSVEWCGKKYFGPDWPVPSGAGITPPAAGQVSAPVNIQYWFRTTSSGTTITLVDMLTDGEYERLQKLRQAVKDAETEIAKAHGVYLAPPQQCLSDTLCITTGMAERPSDTYEFRGQFLLINVPEGGK